MNEFCLSDTDHFVSPIGSPLKYSPRDWPQSIHTFNRNSIHNLRGNLFSDDSNDSKHVFEINGIDVPLDTNNWKPFVRSVPRQTPAAQYQLFNGFSYAKMSAVGDKPIKEMPDRCRNRRRVKTQTFCSFCKNNNETPEVYNSHVVKDPEGRTTCPVLRDYDCPKCRSGGGDNGHTFRYCPLNKPGVDNYIPSVIKQLKNSRSADGKKRIVV